VNILLGKKIIIEIASSVMFNFRAQPVLKPADFESEDLSFDKKSQQSVIEVFDVKKSGHIKLKN